MVGVHAVLQPLKRGDLKQRQWRSEVGKGKQPAQCVIKRLNTAGSWTSGDSVEHTPQRWSGGARELGAPTPHSEALPHSGLPQRMRMWRPEKTFRQRRARAGVAGQACVQPTCSGRGVGPSLLC